MGMTKKKESSHSLKIISLKLPLLFEVSLLGSIHGVAPAGS
jgi:hypothetical protein